jgi:hypothetical protein
VVQNVKWLAFAGNCGDWVETCSALIEQHDGKIDLVRCPPLAKHVQTRPQPRELIGSGA